MASTLITDWLNGRRNYTYGCILYNRLGGDDDLKQLFEKGKTPYTEKKLLESLQALANPAEKKAPAARYAESFPVSSNKILNALRDQWMPLYTEMNYKRHQLDKFLFQKTGAAMVRRARLAMDILNLEKRCMVIWATRDFYNEFGHLPQQEKPEPVVDPAKLADRYKNVQAYIRKYKMYLKRDPANPRNIEILQQYEKEFEEIKRKR